MNRRNLLRASALAGSGTLLAPVLAKTAEAQTPSTTPLKDTTCFSKTRT